MSHILIISFVSYLLMNVLPRNFQYKVVFSFNLFYLSAQHIHTMLTNFGGWDLNATTYTMILITKLSALSFCYKDGIEKEENLFPEQKALKVVKMPSLIEYFSYVFFSGGCIMGPFFEYTDYINFIERKSHYSDMPANTMIPSLVRLMHGFRKFTSNECT